MQTKMKDNNVDPPPESSINGLGLRCSEVGASSDNNIKQLTLNDSDETFYEKLYNLYESAGLNLVLNIRETLLNLHVFYKEVTERGGYHQVTKDKRWKEVSVAMKLKEARVNIAQQLQRVYALFLYQLEQIYFYRAPAKSPSQGKRKSLDTTPVITNEDKGLSFQSEAKKLKDVTGGTMTEQNKLPRTPSKVKEKTKNSKFGRPKRIRTAYQIFIKRECERLRGCLGEKLIGKSFRFMADDAWRRLSEIDRQPYIDESNKDREIFFQELNALKELHGDYHVKPVFELPTDIPVQETVDSAIEITQNSSTLAEPKLENVGE